MQGVLVFLVFVFIFVIVFVVVAAVNINRVFRSGNSRLLSRIRILGRIILIGSLINIGRLPRQDSKFLTYAGYFSLSLFISYLLTCIGKLGYLSLSLVISVLFEPFLV